MSKPFYGFRLGVNNCNFVLEQEDHLVCDHFLEFK